MTSPQDADLIDRALGAFFISGGRGNISTGTAVHEIDGRRYVVVRGATGTLAVYRVRTSGTLRRLTRWPNSLN